MARGENGHALAFPLERQRVRLCTSQAGNGPRDRRAGPKMGREQLTNTTPAKNRVATVVGSAADTMELASQLLSGATCFPLSGMKPRPHGHPRPSPVNRRRARASQPPGPASRQGLAEKQVCKHKIHLRAGAGRVEQVRQTGRPENRRRGDDRTQGRLRVADELRPEKPHRVEEPQAPAEQLQQRIVPRLPTQYHRGQADLVNQRDP